MYPNYNKPKFSHMEHIKTFAIVFVAVIAANLALKAYDKNKKS